MIQTLEAMLRPHLGAVPTPLHFMKLGAEEYPDTSTALLLLAFLGSSRRPAAVVKVARAAAGDAIVTREATMLERAQTQLPAPLAAQIPRLLEQGSVNGRAFLAMTALPGEIEMHHTWGAQRADGARLHAALQWGLDAATSAPAAAIDAATWIGQETVDAAVRDAAALGYKGPWHERLEERLGPAWATPWPAGLAHGDFFPGNLLFHRRSLTGVVDWALGAERAPIFQDVLTYEFSFAVDAARRGKPLGAQEWRAVQALPPFAAARARLAALGVDTSSGGAARVATLLALYRSARACGRDTMSRAFLLLLAAELTF